MSGASVFRYPWFFLPPSSRFYPVSFLDMNDVNEAEVVSLRLRLNLITLPLMGIGNLGADAACRYEIELITPHGDWKPAWVALTNGRPADLITPHGDWKRGRPNPWPSTARSHYPSWGLETTSCSRPERLCPVLITPHGDWKRGEARPSYVPEPDSLPLMGIGNKLDHNPPSGF